MRAQELPLIGGFYADETRPWSQQDICNYLPCAAESDGTRTPRLAKTPPGLSPFARMSGDPVRGVYSAEDRLFAVMGNTLYQFTPTTAVELGAISGTGRVRFAHNQITGGNQVLIVNGSSGWVFNTVTGTLTLITDSGYPGAINARFIDGYLIQIEPARRYAFHSDLADALSYNTLDRFTSEVAPDMLVSMAVSNNELLLFSESTTEFFENTGAAQQPFRSKRISFNKGCAGRYTVAEMDNTVFWLGDDGVFYLLDGYSPKRISTRPIEQAIRGLNWAQAFAFVWEDSGHAVCYWTFPDGLTFGYDASQGKWHRRASYGLNRWRVQDMAYWRKRWIAGDFQKGRLWELDWLYPLEFDEEFISELTSPVIHDNQSLVLMPRMEVIMDTGMPEVEIRDFTIDQAALSITGDVPDGFVGDAVDYDYTVTGGIPTVLVSLHSGSLPPGTTLSSSGTVSGTYTTAGSYSWEVIAVDADGNTDLLADTAEVEESLSLFAAVDNLLTLQAGDGASFPTTVTTGLTTTTSNVCVAAVGGRVFHLGTGTEGRSSSNGSSFVACTGLTTTSGITPGNGTMLKIGSEWQLYHDGLHVSTDGIAFSERAVPSGSVYRPVNIGNTVVAIFGGRFLQVSTDASVTFSAYNASASLNTSEGVQRLLAIPAVGYRAFGRDGSGNLLIGSSATGASASWTFGAGPATAICHGVARNATTGRIVMVLQTGATWHSDNNCSSWTAGAAVPYAGASAFPPITSNNMIFANGYFYFCAAQGGGVNRIYRSPDGVTAWAQVYSLSSGNAIESIAEFVP